MENTLQLEFQKELHKKYQMLAFESLAHYAFYGQKYAAVEKQVKEYEARIKAFEADLEKRKGEKSEEARKLNHAVRQDIQLYKKRIAGIDGTMKKLWEKSVSRREEGVTLLEQAEFMQTFKMKTPEEIEADKHAKVEEKPEEKIDEQ